MHTMKFGIVPFFFLFAVQLQSQCFTGLDSFYCADDPPAILTPDYPGGTFYGEGCGSDGFYPTVAGPGTFVVNYLNAGIYTVDTTGTFDPVEGTGTEVSLPDDGYSDGIPIGFDFLFFGLNQTQFRIRSDGFITFNFAVEIFPPGAGEIPYLGYPNNFIAAAWADYDPTIGGTIEYFTTGTEPYRKTVINYIDVPGYSGTDLSITSQIILYETTNIIEIHTTSSPSTGTLKTQGIENFEGTVGYVRPGRNRTDWEAFNDYVAFIPGQCSETTTVYPLPPVNIEEPTLDVCKDGFATVHVSGAETYVWSPPGIFTVSGSDAYSVNGAALAVPTEFYLTGTSEHGCTAVDSVLVTPIDCDAIQTLHDAQAVNLYPNPATDILFIDAQETIDHIVVRDISGKMVMEKNNTTRINQIDISILSPGAYFLEAGNDAMRGTYPFFVVHEK